METKGLHIRVSGSVQGVGYRFYCRQAADNLGVDGWVMNLMDGDVEMEVFGTHKAVFAYLNEVTRHDRGFIVTGMRYEQIPDEKRYKGFTIRVEQG